MLKNTDYRVVVDVIEIETFLNSPPRGFAVERRAGCRLVKFDPDDSCVFIDEFQSGEGKVIFCNSPGRKVTVRTLGEYTDMRRRLTSRRIYILISACAVTNNQSRNATALGYYVMVVNGCHPMIRWEMERGLDLTISSVAGESYKVDIDFSTALHGWISENFRIVTNGEKVKPIWRDTHITMKYRSDALFDFPHWFGFSKRQFNVSYHGRKGQHPKSFEAQPNTC